MVAFCEKLELYTWNYFIYSSHLKLRFMAAFVSVARLLWWMRELDGWGHWQIWVAMTWWLMVNEASKWWQTSSGQFQACSSDHWNWMKMYFSSSAFPIWLEGCSWMSYMPCTKHHYAPTPKTIAIKSASINNQARWNRAASSNQRHILVSGATKKAGEKWNTVIYKLSTNSASHHLY